MNPEIKKFIDLVLADGEITDKERSVILKKAVKLGEDPDEIEMILDSSVNLLSKNKSKVIAGQIKTCPSCGESISNNLNKCSFCGTTFSKFENKFIQKFIDKVSNSTNTSNYIKLFDIPNNIEDVIDLLTYVSSIAKSSDSSSNDYKSWVVLYERSIDKLDYLNKGEYDQLLHTHKQDLNQIKWNIDNIENGMKNNLNFLILLIPGMCVFYLMLSLLFYVFGNPIWPFN